MPQIIKISIITATFNAEKYIEKSMLSVLPQLSDDIEYIIIDGGSKDSTVDVIKKYAADITYWISEKDQGIYDAWNKGVNVARGDWVMFLGADDYLKPDAIQNYLQMINTLPLNEEVLYISSRLEQIEENGKVIRILGWPWKWEEFRRHNIVAHPGSLHARKLFTTYGYFDVKYKICGDYELLLRPKEKLNALFLNKITAQMTFGGVSSQQPMVKELYKAVTKTGGTNRYLACYDFLVLSFKLQMKRLFKGLGFNLKWRKD